MNSSFDETLIHVDNVETYETIAGEKTVYRRDYARREVASHAATGAPLSLSGTPMNDAELKSSDEEERHELIKGKRSLEKGCYCSRCTKGREMTGFNRYLQTRRAPVYSGTRPSFQTSTNKPTRSVSSNDLSRKTPNHLQPHNNPLFQGDSRSYRQSSMTFYPRFEHFPATEFARIQGEIKSDKILAIFAGEESLPLPVVTADQTEKEKITFIGTIFSFICVILCIPVVALSLLCRVLKQLLDDYGDMILFAVFFMLAIIALVLLFSTESIQATLAAQDRASAPSLRMAIFRVDPKALRNSILTGFFRLS